MEGNFLELLFFVADLRSSETHRIAEAKSFYYSLLLIHTPSFFELPTSYQTWLMHAHAKSFYYSLLIKSDRTYNSLPILTAKQEKTQLKNRIVSNLSFCIPEELGH